MLGGFFPGNARSGSSNGNNTGGNPNGGIPNGNNPNNNGINNLTESKEQRTRRLNRAAYQRWRNKQKLLQDYRTKENI